ncbi:hypothetical protein HED52_19895 [Ochrobactrum ciceri]|uniref:Uncharacterized protein n=1 Tax=Brucella ciceri TaxID=391287 RepID=A0ABX1DVR0_9HYPH|nr:hypothetical protein [Brucella ciceri]
MKRASQASKPAALIAIKPGGKEHAETAWLACKGRSSKQAERSPSDECGRRTVRDGEKMFTRFNNRFGRAFAQFGSAVRASAAVRAGQKPTAQDLETLGIDVDQLRRIQG